MPLQAQEFDLVDELALDKLDDGFAASTKLGQANLHRLVHARERRVGLAIGAGPAIVDLLKDRPHGKSHFFLDRVDLLANHLPG